jgi:hypothetical protein
MFQEHPEKMRWFKEQEGLGKKRWRSDIPYSTIEKGFTQLPLLHAENFDECDSGYCGT